MDPLTDSLLQHGGPFAILLVASVMGAKRLYGDVQKAKDDRVTDAQGTVTKVLEVIEKAEQSKLALVKAINENTEATRSLAGLKDELAAVRVELAQVKVEVTRGVRA